jgi:hypothetical protein
MCSGAHAGGLVNVLVAERDAQQRPLAPRHHGAFGCAGGREGLALGDQQEGVQPRVGRLDPGQKVFDQFDR